MKMKKLLAGVLSAAMVATMIPASMAFSGVSAEVPTNGLVLALDYDDQTMANSANNDSIGAPIKGSSAQNAGGFWNSAVAPTTYYSNSTGSYLMADNSTANYHLSSLIASGDENSIYSSTATTVSFWISDISTAANGNVLGHDEFAIYTTTDNQIGYVEGGRNASFANSTDKVQTVDYMLQLPDDGWHMVTLTNNNGTYQWYLDGEIYEGSSTGRASMFDTVMYGFLYGAGYGSVNLKAAVDNFYIYNATLTAEQVSALYEATEVDDAATEPTLLASYDLTDSDLRGTWTTSSEVTVGENGITVPAAHGSSNQQTATLGNPYATYPSTEGLTVVLNMNGVTAPADADAFDMLFGFKSDRVFFGVGGNGYNVRYNDYYNNNAESNYYDSTSEASVTMTDDTRYVLTVLGNRVELYANGALIASYDPAMTVRHNVAFAATDEYIASLSDFVVGSVSTMWGQYGATFTEVSFYNGAMSADEVAENYAQSIADSLDLEVIGVQKGYLGDNQANTAVRFVANLNVDAVTTYNNVITNVGWAWEMTSAENPAFTADYSTAKVTTVTSDTDLTKGDDTKYAYTLVGASEGENATFYSAAPYAVINVNGTDYTFCYNGKGMSYVSEASTLVYAPVNFAEKTVDNSL